MVQNVPIRVRNDRNLRIYADLHLTSFRFRDVSSRVDRTDGQRVGTVGEFLIDVRQFPCRASLRIDLAAGVKFGKSLRIPNVDLQPRPIFCILSVQFTFRRDREFRFPAVPMRSLYLRRNARLHGIDHDADLLQFRLRFGTLSVFRFRHGENVKSVSRTGDREGKRPVFRIVNVRKIAVSTGFRKLHVTEGRLAVARDVQDRRSPFCRGHLSLHLQRIFRNDVFDVRERLFRIVVRDGHVRNDGGIAAVSEAEFQRHFISRPVFRFDLNVRGQRLTVFRYRIVLEAQNSVRVDGEFRDFGITGDRLEFQIVSVREHFGKIDRFVVFSLLGPLLHETVLLEFLAFRSQFHRNVAVDPARFRKFQPLGIRDGKDDFIDARLQLEFVGKFLTVFRTCLRDRLSVEGAFHLEWIRFRIFFRRLLFFIRIRDFDRQGQLFVFRAHGIEIFCVSIVLEIQNVVRDRKRQ